MQDGEQRGQVIAILRTDGAAWIYPLVLLARGIRFGSSRRLLVDGIRRRGRDSRSHTEERDMDRSQSAAYAALRASSRLLLLLVEAEIAKQGGKAQIFHDQLAVVGSWSRVVRPGMAELHALGLVEVTRHPKRFLCASSDRWRAVQTSKEAAALSETAREQRQAVPA
jgi:hypothetical protein